MPAMNLSGEDGLWASTATYEATKTDGRRFRNTEILGFDGDRVSGVEVYFGWDVE